MLSHDCVSALQVLYFVESLQHFVLSNRAASSSSVSTSCFRVPHNTVGGDIFFLNVPLLLCSTLLWTKCLIAPYSLIHYTSLRLGLAIYDQVVVAESRKRSPHGSRSHHIWQFRQRDPPRTEYSRWVLRKGDAAAQNEKVGQIVWFVLKSGTILQLF